MKIKFKTQAYQTAAVESVVDCFVGQPVRPSIEYRVDPGNKSKTGDQIKRSMYDEEDLVGFKNSDVSISNDQLHKNIHEVERRQGLPVSSALVSTKVCPINLDIEMETGTGKTYCYIKTMFEMNKLYGLSLIHI